MDTSEIVADRDNRVSFAHRQDGDPGLRVRFEQKDLCFNLAGLDG
jgi:hypothetical protein